jgi:hypothetical protein
VKVNLVRLEFWGPHYLCDSCKAEWDLLTDQEKKDEPLENAPIKNVTLGCAACLKEEGILPA